MMICAEGSTIIQVDPFMVDVLLIENFKQMQAWAESNFHEQDAMELKGLWWESNGFAFSRTVNGEKMFVVAIREKRHETVCHEAVHCSGQIMQAKNIPWTNDTDEVRAYLTGYLFEKICAALKLRIVK